MRESGKPRAISLAWPQRGTVCDGVPFAAQSEDESTGQQQIVRVNGRGRGHQHLAEEDEREEREGRSAKPHLVAERTRKPAQCPSAVARQSIDRSIAAGLAQSARPHVSEARVVMPECVRVER